MDKKGRIEILQKVADGELTPEQADRQLSGLSTVGIPLRDYFAVEAMKSKIMVWDSVLPDKHRLSMLKEMMERYGKTITVGEGLARASYDVADDMMKVRDQ